MIFRSLKEDRAKGVCGSGIYDRESQDGVGNGQEPKGRGREYQGKGCGAGVLDQTPCIGKRGTGCCTDMNHC